MIRWNRVSIKYIPPKYIIEALASERLFSHVCNYRMVRSQPRNTSPCRSQFWDLNDCRNIVSEKQRSHVVIQKCLQ